ncbi:hypothetical protein SAMN05216200_10738 [Oceanicella actignis]|uniref:DNA repair protein MmcB-related protein n=2 Tax=Oceanicella actignis TaxID=1189325 RepID=A0A1M7TJJ1_9RHOB|nr:hypothetical protein LY05_02314 [Oceanicella actignis]SET66464.1 hypothetical protein SAMN04488119_10739 [Oceanicella actignis]SHN70856.1 hypothetical protein SAMN05216200_10738 [Oceanicella actignis]
MSERMTQDAPPRPGALLARGVCRYMLSAGIAPVTEFAPEARLRADVMGVDARGRIWIVECKSSLADFRADAKWRGYLAWCDLFAFAAPADFPHEALPEDEGLLIADGYGAELIRLPAPRPLPPARRKALTLRLAMAAARRLRAALDPGAAAFDSLSGED